MGKFTSKVKSGESSVKPYEVVTCIEVSLFIDQVIPLLRLAALVKEPTTASPSSSIFSVINCSN